MVADEWATFRVDYLAAEADDFGAWADRWREMAESDLRFDGGVEV